MTNQEMISVLKGSQEGKLNLFNQLTEKVMGGDALDDNEIPVFEALKKELFKPAPQIIQMEATVIGTSGVKI